MVQHDLTCAATAVVCVMRIVRGAASADPDHADDAPRVADERPEASHIHTARRNERSVHSLLRTLSDSHGLVNHRMIFRIRDLERRAHK
jgi:hypothetical protein